VPQTNLTDAILEAHRVDAADASAQGIEPLEIRPDQVLAGGVAAVVALAAFEGLGPRPLIPDAALVGAERNGLEAAFGGVDELRRLHDASRRVGAYFVRPGDGRCEQTHFERLAAPGRLLCSAGRRTPLAGALAMLVLPCGALEAAAALGGRPIDRRWSGSMVVELEGALSSGVDGHDVACALLERLGEGGARGRWIEFAGAGVASLGMMARVAIVSGLERLGAPAGLFPSDDVTRQFLMAQRRDADWRRFDSGGGHAIEPRCLLSLPAVEPMTRALEGSTPPRPVRESRGVRIGAVVIGAATGVADLSRLARALNGRRVHDDVSLRIASASRQVRETAEATGIVAALRDAGAEWVDGALEPSGASNGIAYGATLGELSAGKTTWHTAGIATCAAAALSGVLGDPRDIELSGVDEEPVTEFMGSDALRVVPPGDETDPAPARVFPFGQRLDAPMRGQVLGCFGDRVATDQVLPWGARVRSLVGDFEALSAHAFGRLDPEFAARARAAGGGFVVAGVSFGIGEPWDTAALALVRLGIRAVIARSHAPDFARLLALAGVIPLEWANATDARAVSAGDELEFPGLPETFVAGRPLVARNLTRGTQYTVRHPLGAREVERLRHGGLLADMGRP
jgi:aconitate hydratase